MFQLAQLFTKMTCDDCQSDHTSQYKTSEVIVWGSHTSQYKTSEVIAWGSHTS